MNNRKQTPNKIPETNLLYITSDEQVFFDNNIALRHSRTLDDQAIVTMTQKEAEAQLERLSKYAEEDEQDDLLDSLTRI